MLRSEVMVVFSFSVVSNGTGAAGFILITKLSKLAEKVTGRLNATWNSVKQQAIKGVCRGDSRGFK